MTSAAQRQQLQLTLQKQAQYVLNQTVQQNKTVPATVAKHHRRPSAAENHK